MQLLTVTLLTALATTISALPSGSNTVYPDVVPGPGLPSLEELGLTVEELYTNATPIVISELESRALEARGNCDVWQTASSGSAIACKNYLANLGTKACRVDCASGCSVRFCSSGDAQIIGANANGPGGVSSQCRDVASGAQWVIDHCNNNGRIGGWNAAGGNGYLDVGVGNINTP